MSAEELNELFKACIKEPEPEITYSGMKLSNEDEDQIRQLCEEYNNVPLQIMLTIGYQESDGMAGCGRRQGAWCVCISDDTGCVLWRDRRGMADEYPVCIHAQSLCIG